MVAKRFAEALGTQLVAGLLSLGLAALILLTFEQFQQGAQLYDWLFLAVSGTVFLVVAFIDIYGFRSDVQFYVVGGIYLVAFVVFVILTSWGDQRVVQGHIPVYSAFGVVGIARLVQIGREHHKDLSERKTRRKVGFATTGILILETAGQKPRFVLLLNRNLRGGKGLWVPPGGHFVPHRESPEERLVPKMESEVGLACNIFRPYRYGRATRNEDLTTEACQWLTPPVFLLRESMMGECTHSHTLHLDFIYLCTTAGKGLENNPTYDQSQQIRVPLEACRPSLEAAEAAIGAAIDEWYLANTGVMPGLSEDLTRDVCWRLHLASCIYLEAKALEERR